MSADATHEYPWVIRTDFADNSAWESVCGTARAPVCDGDEEFLAYIQFVNSHDYKDCTVEEIRSRLPKSYNYGFLFVVDRITISHPESPLLVVDLHDEPFREFRTIPTQVQSIENNLSIANMDYEEFADAVDEDGIFRGFPSS
jgi:hypothetical protein